MSVPAIMKTLIWNEYVGMHVGEISCFCCNVITIYQMNFHAGHIISKNDGGKLELENLRPICQRCNSSMGTNDMITFMESMNLDTSRIRPKLINIDVKTDVSQILEKISNIEENTNTKETKFRCKRCCVEYSTKQNLIMHLKRTKDCPANNNISRVEILKEYEFKEKTYKCRYCSNTYDYIPSRSRHEKTCTSSATVTKSKKFIKIVIPIKV